MFKYFANKLISILTYKLLIKEVNGLENIPSREGFILASNHTSYLDILVMYASLLSKTGRYARFMAKKELLNDKIFRKMAKLFEFKKNKVIILDLNNPKAAFDEATFALKHGQVVAIYPEGGRSRTGKIQRGKTGAIRLALRSKVPIVPMGIEGTYKLMPGTSKPRIKKIVKLNIGNPINLSDFYSKKLNKSILNTLTNNLMKTIAKLSGQRYNP